MTAERSVVIHGHFYQPPREDPWIGEVEAEPSAAPYHDWNVRIDHECYRAVAAARIPGPDGRVVRIVDTLASISFDVGPTLLNWLERESPVSYAAFLSADRASRERTGFGNAIAMPYHHVILPLCTRRDKVTEVRWGIRDFERRFGRRPEGMWLPETAVDEESLDVLAAEGIRFTVLGPEQVTRVPPTGLPGRYRAATGRSIAIFVYDGGVAHDVAFGPLVRDGARWADRMTHPPGGPRQLVSMATDGETWGHHHRFGEMALAATLERLARTPGIRVENFAAVLARHPASEAIEIVAPSSWSCPHGVGRWREECGCRIAPQQPSQQTWRAPLRAGIDWLAARLHEVFEREGADHLADPWQSRDEHGGAVGVGGSVPGVRGRELLEMERNALAMYTSCGWFFDDVGGIETILVLRHAARAIELAGDAGPQLEAGLVQRLALAPSNEPAIGDGGRLYLSAVKASRPAPVRAAAGFAGVRLVAPDAAAVLPGYEPTTDGSGVRDTRTGREYRIEIEARRPADGRLVIRSGGQVIDLLELPEHHRAIVRGAMVRDLVHARFPAGKLDELAAGQKDLGVLAAEVLTDAAGAPGAGGERLDDLLDLLDLLGIPVPFDAQTRFYLAWKATEGERRGSLALVAERFGVGGA